MLAELLILAQEVPGEGSAIFNLRNGILVFAIIALLVGLKIYKNKTMG
ncbi:MAG: hypothetical protein ABII12_00255 [Planctomycetota bacterium]